MVYIYTLVPRKISFLFQGDYISMYLSICSSIHSSIYLLIEKETENYYIVQNIPARYFYTTKN